MVKRHVSRSRGAVAVVVLALALVGCGDETGDPDEPDTAANASESGDPTTAVERTHAPQPENPDGAPCEYVPGGEPAKQVELPASTAAYSGTVEATLITNQGDIGLTLDASAAPCAVNSFTSLASQGYFDGTDCHRLTTEGIFVLQCGDPTATGGGSPGYTFADELTGSETYPAGTIAMANAGPSTNGSQFFLVYEETPLPPSYVVFGTIDEAGIGVVADIAAAGSEPVGDGAPVTATTIDFAEIGAETAVAEPTEPAGACTYTPDGTVEDVVLPSAKPAAGTKKPVKAVITTSVGRIPITLDAADAPCTVGSFVTLAEDGFFDDTSCHRLTTSGILVLQCGDPTGTGMGGPGYSFADELSGKESYPTGTLAMANAGPDTNGSQFFMVYGETPLPPSYTVFGTISPAGVKVVQNAADAGVTGGGSDGTPKTAVTFTKVAIG